MPSAGRARKGARRQVPAEAGARPIPSKASTTTAAIRRSINAGRRCWAAAAFADLIRFQGRRMGPATPGVQVRCAKPLGLRYRLDGLLRASTLSGHRSASLRLQCHSRIRQRTELADDRASDGARDKGTAQELNRTNEDTVV